jgi:hypothetical protein
MLVFEDVTKCLFVYDRLTEAQRMKNDMDLSLIDSFLSSIEDCVR